MCSGLLLQVAVTSDATVKNSGSLASSAMDILSFHAFIFSSQVPETSCEHDMQNLAATGIDC